MQSVNVCFFGCSSYERVLELFIDAKQDLGEILSGTRRAALRLCDSALRDQLVHL